MIGHLFCPRCGKRSRSERHHCDPSAIKAKEAFEARWGKKEAKK